MRKDSVLVSSCCNWWPKTGWLKQQTFASHNFEGWEVQDQSSGRAAVQCEPVYQFADDLLFAVTSHGREQGRGELSGVSSY